MIRGRGGARRRATTATGGARRVAVTMAQDDVFVVPRLDEDNGAGRGTARGLYPRKIFSPSL